MSPHGSKLIEFIRFLANKFLTDQQRKKIKNTLAKLQRIPLKLLGIESLINAQKDEIERLKARQLILDGKFNTALYGLPRLEDPLKAVAFSPSALQFADSPFELRALVSQPEQGLNDSRLRTALEVFQSQQSLKSFAPKTALLSGIEDLGAAEKVLGAIAGLERAFIAGPHLSSGQSSDRRIQILQTDSTTAMATLSGVPLDFIASFYQYQHLAPVEQVSFLRLAHKILRPGGFLCLILPPFKPTLGGDDPYWKDPRNLRPYSTLLIEELLSTLGGSFRRLAGNDQEVIYQYQKGSQIPCE